MDTCDYWHVENGRTGHLFQNRFKSETVNTDVYFFTVLRYNHQNSSKAKMVDKLEEYKWSSYNAYIKNDTEVDLIDSAFALGFFRDIQDFKAYMKEKTEDKCLEYSSKKRYTDEGLKETIYILIDNIYLLQTLDKQSRDNLLKRIKETT